MKHLRKFCGLKKAILIVSMIAVVMIPLSLKIDSLGINVAEAAAAPCTSTNTSDDSGHIVGSACDTSNLSSGCQAAVAAQGSINTVPAACNNDSDKSILNTLQDIGYSSPGLLNSPQDKTTVAKTSDIKTTTTDCSSVLVSMANPFTCMFRSLVSNTAASLIWIARWLLVFSGALFNWLVDNTIVHFGAVYTSLVQKAVQDAWTAFRDIANILIIGIFAFIAISIILGLKTFGQKKLIANVLIVAVLINFSLLFSQIIIDASNFTATQIYAAAALGTVSPIGTSSGTTGTVGVTTANVTGANAGIAGQFIFLLGVQSFGDTKTALDNIAQAQDNGWIALFHGLFVFAILVAAALVLFYGSFLLVSRVILIIFLMVTASVAFASYLVPKWQTSHYGWDTWWNSLIKSATFAPILMFFLWMTLTVSYAIHGAPGMAGGSFGAMAADPTKTNNTSVFVSYAIILGLLFISFKLSSVFASKIAGFNLAGSALANLAAPLTLGSQFLLGPLGRQVLGRSAAHRSLSLDDQIDTEKVRARETKDYKPLEKLMRAKQRADRFAGGSYNPMNAAAAKAVVSGLGVSKLLSGADKKPTSFAEGAKATADKAAKEAAGLALSQEDKNKIRETAETQEVQRRRDIKEDRTLKKQQHKEEIEAIKAEHASETAPLEGERSREESVKGALEKKHEDILKGIAKDIAGATDEATKAGHQERYNNAKTAQKTELNEQDNKIREIDRKLTDVYTKTAIPELENKIHDIDKELDGLDKEKVRVVGNNAVREAEEKTRDMATKVGARLAYGTLTSALQSATGINPEKTVAGKMAFKQTKKKIRVKASVERRNAEAEEIRGAGEKIEDEPSAPATETEGGAGH
jgi:hypothetical protein